jgi:serine/threonine protein kinase
MPTLLNNRYLIISALGSGGFGNTFLVEDTHMPSRRRCVLKQLKPISDNSQVYQMVQELFWREAAILENLGEQHNQIPKLYAYFAEAGHFYLVQELIAGATLQQKMQAEGRLPESLVKQIVASLLSILDFIHTRKIIHRDIKPSNLIWRTWDNKPVLIDFGAVKQVVNIAINSQGQTTSSSVIGTPGFMPPEQAAGRPVYASDLYSLGLTAIYLLTGKPPETLDVNPQTGEIDWRRYAADVSPSFAAVLDKAIQLRVENRYTTAQEMQAALSQSAHRFLTNPFAQQRSRSTTALVPLNSQLPTAIIASSLLFASLIAGIFAISNSLISSSPKILAGGHSKAVDSIAFSPDGNMLASGGRDWKINLWNLQTGDILNTFGEGSNRANITAIAFSNNEQLFFSGDSNGSIKIWDRNQISQFVGEQRQAHSSTITSLAFTSPENILISGDSNGTIKTWNAIIKAQNVQIQERSIRQNHSRNSVSAIAIHPADGKTVASGDFQGSIKVWNVDTGQENFPPLQAHANTILSLTIKNNGNLISGSSDRTIKLWKLEGNQAILNTEQPFNYSEFNSFAISPRGNSIARGTNNGQIEISPIQ